jgi:hypothetical protein
MSTRLVAYVGCYSGGGSGGGPVPDAGGIHLLGVSPDGRRLTLVSRVAEPGEAGYLAYAPSLGTLYAVDERKTHGRGPGRPGRDRGRDTPGGVDGELAGRQPAQPGVLGAADPVLDPGVGARCRTSSHCRDPVVVLVAKAV